MPCSPPCKCLSHSIKKENLGRKKRRSVLRPGGGLARVDFGPAAVLGRHEREKGKRVGGGTFILRGRRTEAGGSEKKRRNSHSLGKEGGETKEKKILKGRVGVCSRRKTPGHWGTITNGQDVTEPPRTPLAERGEKVRIQRGRSSPAYTQKKKVHLDHGLERQRSAPAYAPRSARGIGSNLLRGGTRRCKRVTLGKKKKNPGSKRGVGRNRRKGPIESEKNDVQRVIRQMRTR